MYVCMYVCMYTSGNCSVRIMSTFRFRDLSLIKSHSSKSTVSLRVTRDRHTPGSFIRKSDSSGESPIKGPKASTNAASTTQGQEGIGKHN